MYYTRLTQCVRLVKMSCLQRDFVKVILKFQKLFYGFSYVYVVRIFSQCVSSISESKVSDLSFQSYISYSKYLFKGIQDRERIKCEILFQSLQNQIQTGLTKYHFLQVSFYF